MSMAPFQDLPLDILHPILSQLADRKDWHACTLVSKAFSRVATPFLYRTLDSRIISKTLVHHPSTTLLRRPDLAQHVRRVTETGAIHRGMLVRYPNITRDTLAALALCINLASLTWIDDTSSTNTTLLLSFLDVIRVLPVKELTIRTHSDLGEEVWAQLITLTGLRKVSLWCMEGPPRVLQGWSEPLGSTLTHLELGRCAGVPPSVLITVLAQLPLLKDLRLKGAPASAIPTILTYLPNLQSLDTEYLLSGSGAYYSKKRRVRHYQPKAIKPASPKPKAGRSPASGSEEHDHLPSSSPSPISSPSSPSSSSSSEDDEPPLPTLRSLTVRTSSMDTFGPQKLWGWIQDLVPRPGLQKLKLHAFTFNMGYTGIPRMFILDLARMHGGSLREFVVGEAHLTLGDVECLCTLFAGLEVLVCSVASPDVDSIINAISPAKNLQTLKLQVQWIPSGGGSAMAMAMYDQHDYDYEQEYDRPDPHARYANLGVGGRESTYIGGRESTYVGGRESMYVGGRESTYVGGRESISTERSFWRQGGSLGLSARSGGGGGFRSQREMFTLEDARRMMLRSEESRLRVIGIGHVQYTGKWVLEDEDGGTQEDEHEDGDGDADSRAPLQDDKSDERRDLEEQVQVQPQDVVSKAEGDNEVEVKNEVEDVAEPPTPNTDPSTPPKKKGLASTLDSRLKFVVFADLAEDRWKT